MTLTLTALRESPLAPDAPIFAANGYLTGTAIVVDRHREPATHPICVEIEENGDVLNVYLTREAAREMARVLGEMAGGRA